MIKEGLTLGLGLGFAQFTLGLWYRNPLTDLSD
jgi:hypothetical protein